MAVAVTNEEYSLKEDHRYEPDSGGAPMDRKKRLGDHGLDEKEQEGVEEDNEAKGEPHGVRSLANWCLVGRSQRFCSCPAEKICELCQVPQRVQDGLIRQKVAELGLTPLTSRDEYAYNLRVVQIFGRLDP